MLTYLIKGANQLDGRRKDFLIRDRKIAYAANNLDRLRSIEMNCGGFSITPGRVAVNFSILQGGGSSARDSFIEWQRVGCTTLLVVCALEKEQDLREQLKRARHRMINSSLDYVVGISLPMRKLTPSFVRLCGLEKIPFVLATVESEADFDALSWAWIRDALFSYRLNIVPDWRNLDVSDHTTLKWKQYWLELANQYDIPTLAEFPEGDALLKKEAIRKIGIAPHKGELRTGCDLDYNLYKSTSLADPLELLYDKNSIPDVVVLRGKVMKAGKTVYYRPGFGKEITVRIPGYLAYYPENQ